MPIRGVSLLGGCISLTWESFVKFETFVNSLSDHVHEEGQRHKNCNLQSNLEMKNKNLVDWLYTVIHSLIKSLTKYLFSRVGRKIETKDSHARSRSIQIGVEKIEVLPRITFVFTLQ